MRIGFIGLGAMGFGMARNILAKHGQLATLANRSRDAINILLADGAVEHPDAATLAADTDMILLCLPNSKVVEQTIDAMVPSLRAGQTIIDTGTSSLASTLALSQRLVAMGVHFAESPLTGGQAQADQGILGALVGTTPETFARIAPVLDCFCATKQHFGPVGAGARAKFVNNYMVIGITALVTEAFHIAAETETDWAQLYDVVIRGSADSGVLRRIIGNAKDGDFGGYVFSVENAAKDMGYITEMTAALGRDTPLNHAIKDLLDRATMQGHGPLRLSELLRPEIRAQLFEAD
jgi:3-hydroxyisobutyrate dehydrogenase-like beta-hydroxyacid dehydrogenase